MPHAISLRSLVATPINLPKLGNSVETSLIVAWRKKPGDNVRQGEILAEIETDKASIELESPATGILIAAFFEAGDEVPVQTIIGAIGEAGEDVSSFKPEDADLTDGTGHSPPQDNGSYSSGQTNEDGSQSRVAISPRARHLAQRNGLNLERTHVSSSGPQGRIIERDIQAALRSEPQLTPLARAMIRSGDFVVDESHGSSGKRITTKELVPVENAESPQTALEPVSSVALSGTRRTIATRMRTSLQTTAQVTLQAYADARALLSYRQRLKSSTEPAGLQSISINDLLLFAVARTLVDFLDLNATFENDVITRWTHVHLGFAVDTPRGLIVPVVRAAEQLSLRQLSEEAKQLVQLAADGTIAADNLRGGTFTVSNLGALGIETFTPIINPPQVAILGIGCIHLKAVLEDEEVRHIPHIGLSLTVDHQVVDGAPAARFLQALSRRMASFDLLLAL